VGGKEEGGEGSPGCITKGRRNDGRGDGSTCSKRQRRREKDETEKEGEGREYLLLVMRLPQSRR
jgi:hypothetical protein